MTTTMLWLAFPLVVTVAVALLLATPSTDLDGARKRNKALKTLEDHLGQAQATANDGSGSAGWFVSSDGDWPRRVRLFRMPGPHRKPVTFDVDATSETSQEAR